MKLPAGVVTGIETAINACLRLDPESLSRMEQLKVHCIAIELRGLDLTLYVLPDENGVRLTDRFEGMPDTTLSGTPLALTQLGLGKDRERPLFSGNVEITGNVESGQAFQDILENIDIDWEEQLSRVTGDTVAHHAGNLVRRTGAFLRQGRTTARQNTTEYLQEELRVVPARIEIENFCADVTQLSMDSDRLAARIARLQKKTAAPGEQE